MTLLVDTGKAALKTKMLSACIARQQSLMDDFKERINALLTEEGLGNEDEFDNNHLAQAALRLAEVNMLNDTLAFAAQEMTILQQLHFLEDINHERVKLGAVVVTDKQTFFVSVSIEQFDVDGVTYVGLSTSSPLYQAMKGKSEGETFSFKGTTYTIKEIF